jgi:hypothetical protein
MRWIALPILALILTTTARAGDRDRELRCEEIRQRIEYLYSKMRSGYTRAQGEKMEAELRKLRALRRKACG